MASSVVDPQVSSESPPLNPRRPPIVFPGPARKKLIFAGSYSRNGYGYLNLSGEASTELARIRHMVSYPAGATVFFEGQPCQGVFILSHGHAKLTVANSEGRTLIVRIVTAGDMIGLNPCLADGPYEMTLETTAPSQFAFIRRDDFRELLNNHKDVCEVASKQLISDCRAAYDLVRSIGLSQSTLEKVARFLLRWTAQPGTNKSSSTMNLRFTHDEIGQMIGANRETVTRTLTMLRKKGIIEFAGPYLLIRNRSALERLIP